MLSVIQVVSAPAPLGDGPAGITGPERRAANLAAQWARLGVNVTALYPRRGSLWDVFENSGIRLIDFEMKGKWDVGAVNTLRSHIRTAQAAVIHTQGGPALDLAAVLAARASKIAALVTRPVMIEDSTHRSPPARWSANRIDRSITLPLATHVVAVSNDGFRRLKARVADNRLRLIYNGVPTPQQAFGRHCNNLNGKNGTVHVGMIGHLLPYKGWDDFLEVAARLTASGLDIALHVVGSGPDRPMLEARTVELGLQDRTTFHGLLHDVAPVLQQLDVFLLTSRREGLPVAVLEAMASGLPIIATDVGGLREQVSNGRNGYLVQPGDCQTLAARCAELIASPALRRQFGAESRSIVSERFSETAMLNSYSLLYREIAERTRSATWRR